MNLLFLLSLLVTAAMTVPVDPEEPSTAQDVSHPTSSSTPESVKVASPSKSDTVHILESIGKESDESDESDESKESNETLETQNSKEDILPLHQANVTKTVQPSKDSIDLSAQVPNTKPHPPSSTSVKTIAPVQMSESEAVPTIRDATFLPSKREPISGSPLLLNIN